LRHILTSLQHIGTFEHVEGSIGFQQVEYCCHCWRNCRWHRCPRTHRAPGLLYFATTQTIGSVEAPQPSIDALWRILDRHECTVMGPVKPRASYCTSWCAPREIPRRARAAESDIRCHTIFDILRSRSGHRSTIECADVLGDLATNDLGRESGSATAAAPATTWLRFTDECVGTSGCRCSDRVCGSYDRGRYGAHFELCCGEDGRAGCRITTTSISGSVAAASTFVTLPSMLSLYFIG